MNNTLRFTLLDSQKRPLYVNDAGLVVACPLGSILTDKGLPAHLKFSPEGWKDTLVKYVRNTKYLGLTRDFTVPLDFVEDGALIIKDTMWRQGMDAVLYLSIHRLNGFTFPDKYDHFYTGELDLSKISQSKDSVKVMVVEGGLSKLLKANENTLYDLPINSDQQVKKLYFKGFPITNKVEYTIFGGQDILQDPSRIGMGIVSQEGYTTGFVLQDEDLGYYPNVIPNSEWFAKSYSRSTTLNITGSIKFDKLIAGSGVAMNIYKISEAGTSTAYFLGIPGGLPTGIYTQDFTFAIPVAPGDVLYFVDNGQNGSGGSLAYHRILGGSINITYDTLADDSFVQGLSPKRVLEKLMEKAAPGYGIMSTFLDSLEDSIFLTSGQALRSYGATANLKTSITDFFQSCKRWGVGLSIEGNNLVIERYSYFFRGSTSISIGEIRDYKITKADELIGNTYKFGYPEVDIGKVNARDEFNVTNRFSSPVLRVVKELDFVGMYQAGMYPIEYARVGFFGQDTTDSNVDNTPYMINTNKGADIDYYTGEFEVVSPTEIKILQKVLIPSAGDFIIITGSGGTDGNYETSGAGSFQPNQSQIGIVGGLVPGTYTGTLRLLSVATYKINRPVFDSITGILHPTTAFNILLSPKRGLLENGAFIRSITDFNDFNYITYTAGERNSELSTTVGGVTVTEKANEIIGNLGAPLFCPYFIEFTTNADISYNDTVKVNPYSLVSFSINGVNLTGYLWDGGFNPATNAKQDWKLLLGANNNLSKLINL